MTSREDLDVDDDFSEIYKAYSGPVGSNHAKAQNITTTNKRSQAGSDEEEDARDPNAVPTDFTSREAKVWEAKSKATERNWKKRKEEEMICKICGQSGHFTQGCPSTLGANRKSQDFFERVPARDPHVKALFSESVVNKIEKDIGCKIKIEEKFIIVSGKDRLILKKGVDAVHKIKEDGAESKGPSISPVLHSKSIERGSPLTSRLGRSDSQKSNPSPAHVMHNRFDTQEKIVEEIVREDLQKLSSGSPRAYGSDGGRGQPSQSKSPARSQFLGNSYNSYEGHTQDRGGWNAADRDRSNMQLDRNFDYPSFPQTLEELGLQYKREVMELARIRDKEEDEENWKHREGIFSALGVMRMHQILSVMQPHQMIDAYASKVLHIKCFDVYASPQALKEIWGSCAKKVTTLSGTHAKLWEEFLQHEGQKRQQARQRVLESGRVSESGFGGYKQSGYPEFDSSSSGGLHHHSGDGFHSARGRFLNAMDGGYPSPRPQEPYDNFQRHRRDDFGKPYHRY